MFELQKKVLKGICSKKEYFKKELIKSHAWLNAYELEQLKKRVKSEFYDMHADVIDEVFQKEFDYSFR